IRFAFCCREPSLDHGTPQELDSLCIIASCNTRSSQPDNIVRTMDLGACTLAARVESGLCVLRSSVSAESSRPSAYEPLHRSPSQESIQDVWLCERCECRLEILVGYRRTVTCRRRSLDRRL